MAKSAEYRLAHHIGHMIRRAHQRSVSMFLSEFGEIALTPTQFAALAAIREAGCRSQNLLGRQAAMDPATIQGVLSRLLSRKLVQWETDPNDGRRRLWRLTSEGEKLINRATPLSLECQKKILAPLTPEEQSDLLRLLKKIS